MPEWVDIQPIAVEAYRAIAELVDEGEASAIALALRNINSLLILDDIRARKYAKKLGLKVMGTLGVIAKAEKEGKIASAMDLIAKIQKTNFRLSPKVLDEIRKSLGRVDI